MTRHEIESTDLSLVYRRGKERISALNSVSFSIEKGERVGLLGSNGSGKSSLIKILSGVLKPTSGKVLCLGVDPFEKRRKYIAEVGVFFGHKSFLIPDVPAIRSLELAAAIYKVSASEFKRKVDHMIAVLGIEETLLHRPPRLMSLGQRVKFELISSLLHEPRLLLLDEPLIGVDLISKNSVTRYLKTLSVELGVTILLSSHIISDLKSLCSRFIILHQGRVLFDGNVDQLKRKIDIQRRVEIAVTSESYVKSVSAMLRKFSIDIVEQNLSVSAAVPVGRETEVLDCIANSIHNLGNDAISNITIMEPALDEFIRKLIQK